MSLDWDWTIQDWEISVLTLWSSFIWIRVFSKLDQIAIISKDLQNECSFEFMHHHTLQADKILGYTRMITLEYYLREINFSLRPIYNMFHFCNGLFLSESIIHYCYSIFHRILTLQRHLNINYHRSFHLNELKHLLRSQYLWESNFYPHLCINEFL